MTATLNRPPTRQAPSGDGPSAQSLASRAVTVTRNIRIERWIVVLVPLALELFFGYVLAKHGAQQGDAYSRVQNAAAAVLSRDPHPEAIGFVWGPFPTAFQIPLMALRPLWPFLVTHAYAACVISAVFFAASLWVVHAWCTDLGLPGYLRVGLCALLWLHPLSVALAAGGMSETVVLFFLLVATRALAKYWEGDGMRNLVVASLALGFGYLTRYEVAGAGLLFLGIVTLQAFRQATGDRRSRIRRAGVVGAIAAVPFLSCVVLFAAYSWLIIGEPFAQFTSQYGNSAQVRAGAEGIRLLVGATDGFPRAVYFLRQLLAMVPSLLVVVPLVCIFGVERTKRTWAAVLVLGTPLVLQLVGGIAGTTFAWIRFVYFAYPLAILLIAVVAANLLHRELMSEWFHPLIAVGLTAVIGFSLVTSIPVVRQGRLASAQDQLDAQFTYLPPPYRAPKNTVRRNLMLDQPSVIKAAAAIRRLAPKDGDILTDSAATFGVLLAADNQRWFRITQDRDYEAAAAAPADFSIRWILVSSSNTLDTIAKAHPELRTDGGSDYTLVGSWGQYRLFAINATNRGAASAANPTGGSTTTSGITSGTKSEGN